MLAQEHSPTQNQIVYTLEKDESWVEFQLDLLIQSRPKWALETAIRVKDGLSQLVLDLSGLETAETMDAGSGYPAKLGIERLTAVLDAYEKALDALFDERQLLLEPGHVFFEPLSGKARLMALPITPSAGSKTMESLILSIARAYHLDQESLDRFLSATHRPLADIHSIDAKQAVNPEQSSQPEKCQSTETLEPATNDQKSHLACPILIASHLVLPVLWTALWFLKNSAYSQQLGKNIPESFELLSYLLLGVFSLILLLLDLHLSGIGQKIVSLPGKVWKQSGDTLSSKSSQPTPTGRTEAAVADQTELINVQSSSYRLGLLSVGMPGTPAETEGLRAYILVDEFLIGRDDAICDLPLPVGSVGRRHARITRREGSFFITDLGSKNGTCLDGRRLNKLETYLLPDRCRLEFADQAFYFAAD